MDFYVKSWGYEIWFANSEKYCGKMLFVEHGCWSSKGKYHYHKEKDETFFVIDGELMLDYYDGDEGKRIFLKQYESFTVPPGMKHRFTSESKTGCKFIEASTIHKEEDSIRCALNQEGKWVEFIYG